MKAKDINIIDEYVLNHLPFQLKVKENQQMHTLEVIPSFSFLSLFKSTQEVKHILGVMNDDKDVDLNQILKEKCDYTFFVSDGKVHLEFKLKDEIPGSRKVITYFMQQQKDQDDFNKQIKESSENLNYVSNDINMVEMKKRLIEFEQEILKDIKDWKESSKDQHGICLSKDEFNKYLAKSEIKNLSLFHNDIFVKYKELIYQIEKIKLSK